MNRILKDKVDFRTLKVSTPRYALSRPYEINAFRLNSSCRLLQINELNGRLSVGKGSSLTKTKKYNKMNLHDKVNVFEFSIGAMAVGLELWKDRKDEADTSNLLEETLKNKELVKTLLSRFEENDFSRIKVFVLFHKLFEHSKKYDQEGTFSSSFSFKTKYDLKNIEEELFNFYSHLQPDSDCNMEFSYHGAIIRNKEELPNALAQINAHDNLAITKKGILSWFAKPENINLLFKPEYEFHSGPVEISYLIYEAR